MRIEIKTLLVLSIICTSVFAAISADKAAQIAAPLKDATESINMQPQQAITGATASYWVVEITSFSRIFTLVPINAETSVIENATTIKPIMKTHYLANFFTTHTEIESYLEDTLGMAQQIQGTLETKKADYITKYQPSVPEEVEFTKEQTYIGALESGISASEVLRTKILAIQNIIERITSPDDITIADNSFAELFTAEENLLDKLDAAVVASEAFSVELNTMMNDADSGLSPSLGYNIVNAISLSAIRPNVNTLEDDLTTSKNTINNFFDGIDDQVEQHYSRLLDRLSGKEEPSIKENVATELQDYVTDYNAINNNSSTIDPQFRPQIAELKDMLDEAQDLYIQEDYNAVEETFTDIEEKVSFLKGKVGKWPPTCTGGQVWSGTACACPTGEKLVEGTCETDNGNQNGNDKGGINWNLIYILVGILVALVVIIKLKNKFSGGEQVEETGPMDMYRF